MCIVGVDEAGKGPVLGSMFAAAVRVPSPAVLPSGIRDSKELPASRRVAFARTLRANDRVTVSTIEVPPAEIDAPETDMNTITVDAHAAVIEDVADDSAAVIADASDVNPTRFARRIHDRVSVADVSAKHGADASSPVVAAASVVAKVARDAHIDGLAQTYGAIGSGYPSDPTTLEFLRQYVTDHGHLPACARRSWATSADILAAAEQSEIEDF